MAPVADKKWKDNLKWEMRTSDFPKVKKYGSPSLWERINFPSPVLAEILRQYISQKISCLPKVKKEEEV